jgi:DHA1 family multidrug resistance protein-like MFS transporter
VKLADRLRAAVPRTAPALGGATPAAETPLRPDATGLRATISIGAAVGIGSMSFNFWYPFMPLYLRQIGAPSDADALFWVAVATTVQGVTRLLTGPFWGSLSDRMGRKLMLLRALYLATPTTVIAALVGAPWQMSIALGFQGLFSGFIPAAVALTSVTVPEERLNSSLSIVTGSQYIGTTAGPAVGALLASLLGFRGAIMFAAVLPSLAATIVLIMAPNDQSRTARDPLAVRAPLEPFKPSRQLALILFFYFIIFSMTQLIRLATPIAIKQIHPAHVSSITGLAFTLAGLASAVSVLVIAPRFFRPGNQRLALVSGCVACAGAYLLLSRAGTVPVYVAFFIMISLLQAAMIPPTNALIAGNVPRSRRGTAFGWAGSAQALAFVAGPMGAALFAAVSLDFGFVVLAAILLMMALALIWLKEPDAEPAP